jgi:hypothetical protein
MKEQRSKAKYNREEIKQHMKHFDEVMKSKQEESKQNHLAKIRELKKKNKELEELMQHSKPTIDDHDHNGASSNNNSPQKMNRNDSLSSIDSVKKLDEMYDSIAKKVKLDSKDRQRKYNKLISGDSPAKMKNRQKDSREPMHSVEENGESMNNSIEGIDSDNMSPTIKKISPHTRKKYSQITDKISPDKYFDSPSKYNPSLNKSNDGDNKMILEENSSLCNLDDYWHAQEQSNSDTDKMNTHNCLEIPNVVDPFQHVIENHVVDIDIKDIPTYCTNDWKNMLTISEDRCIEDDFTFLL